MLEHSLIYLLNAYREEGMTVEQAQKKVLEDIAQAEKKYSDAEILPERKQATRLGDPIALVDEIIRNMEPMKTQSKIFYNAIVQKLTHLKGILMK